MRLHDFQQVTCHFGNLDACFLQTQRRPRAGYQLVLQRVCTSMPSPSPLGISSSRSPPAHLTAFFSSTATSPTWTWLADPNTRQRTAACSHLAGGPLLARRWPVCRSCVCFFPLPSPTGQRLAASPGANLTAGYRPAGIRRSATGTIKTAAGGLVLSALTRPGRYCRDSRVDRATAFPPPGHWCSARESAPGGS